MPLNPVVRRGGAFGFWLMALPPCLAPPAALGASSEHAISIAICILAISTPSDSLMIPFLSAFFSPLALSALCRALLRLLGAGTLTDGSEKQAFQVSYCLRAFNGRGSCVVLSSIEILLWPGMIQVGLSSRSLLRFT